MSPSPQMDFGDVHMCWVKVVEGNGGGGGRGACVQTRGEGSLKNIPSKRLRQSEAHISLPRRSPWARVFGDESEQERIHVYTCAGSTRVPRNLDFH